ncbi:hypothetical protein Tco_0016284 [Tanacetum coccineum]
MGPRITSTLAMKSTHAIPSSCHDHNNSWDILYNGCTSHASLGWVCSASIRRAPVGTTFAELIIVLGMRFSMRPVLPGNFWRGKRALTMEDLVLERYIFMLCSDIPPMHSALDLLPSCSDSQNLDITRTKHLLYFGHSILASCGVSIGENFPKLVSCVLEQLQSMLVFEEAEELGWHLLRSGSWLSLVLSLVGAGN